MVQSIVQLPQFVLYKKLGASNHFDFDFISLKSQKKIIYKICKVDDEDVLQGLVAFEIRQDFLYCFNMEISDFNKKPIALYGGIGKAMIALCCKIAYDLGFEGVISFEAKNRLFDYYKRYGATQIGSSIRFFIDEKNAEKLMALYF